MISVTSNFLVISSSVLALGSFLELFLIVHVAPTNPSLEPRTRFLLNTWRRTLLECSHEPCTLVSCLRSHPGFFHPLPRSPFPPGRRGVHLLSTKLAWLLRNDTTPACGRVRCKGLNSSCTAESIARTATNITDA